MELELTSDQEFFAETTRKFLEDKSDVTALRGLRHDENGYDPGYWRQGCELGWTSLLVSEDDGGGSISGEGLEDLMLVAYEFGHHAAPGPLIPVNVVASTLSSSGSPEQKGDVLQGILSGDIVASWAYAEPRPNDRLGAVTLEATPESDGWSLTGTKVAVEAGGMSAYVLVTARTGEGLTQFLVPTDSPGVTVTPMHSVDLTRRFSSFTFDRTKVATSSVVGEVGGAAAQVEHQLLLANVLQCAEMVGAMDRAMDITIEWAFNRYSFGRPLASYQALKHRFADMKTRLEASHGLADGAARAVQDNAPDAVELVSAAKAFIGHFAPEILQECVQMHGGIGITFDHDMHLYLRRVTLDAVLYGTVTDHRLRLTDVLEERKNSHGDTA
jgi:alkylation response protein AidB-like acyl-CoA dehydrogenase